MQSPSAPERLHRGQALAREAIVPHPALHGAIKLEARLGVVLGVDPAGGTHQAAPARPSAWTEGAEGALCPSVFGTRISKKWCDKVQAAKFRLDETTRGMIERAGGGGRSGGGGVGAPPGSSLAPSDHCCMFLPGTAGSELTGRRSCKGLLPLRALHARALSHALHRCAGLHAACACVGAANWPINALCDSGHGEGACTAGGGASSPEACIDGSDCLRAKAQCARSSKPTISLLASASVAVHLSSSRTDRVRSTASRAGDASTVADCRQAASSSCGGGAAAAAPPAPAPPSRGRALQPGRAPAGTAAAEAATAGGRPGAAVCQGSGARGDGHRRFRHAAGGGAGRGMAAAAAHGGPAGAQVC